MRILSSAVILAVALCVGCGEKSKTATTTPPAAAPAPAARAGGAPAAAPAPAPAPAGRAAGAPAAAPAPAAAAGRQGGRGGAPVTIEQHAAAMKQIQQAAAAANKALKGGDTAACNAECGNSRGSVRHRRDVLYAAEQARRSEARTNRTHGRGRHNGSHKGRRRDEGVNVARKCPGHVQAVPRYVSRRRRGPEPYKFNAASGITPP
jgi:hypothetical protein